MAGIYKFRQAIAGWARRYSLSHRYCPDPKPSLAAAQEDLRRFSARYWTPLSPVVAALPALGVRPALPDPTYN